MTASRNDLALLVLRLALGAAFIAHGLPKIEHPLTWIAGVIPHAPPVLGAVAALAEFGGGIAVILGVATRIAAFLIAANMVVAIFVVLLPRGAIYVASGPGATTFELPLAYLATALALVLCGAGALSLDGLRARRRGTPRTRGGTIRRR
jgi:putative oxidoreductase